MGMTKCKECQVEISTKAESCPKCGAKIRRTSPIAMGCLVVLLLFGGLSAVGALLGDEESESASIGSSANPAPAAAMPGDREPEPPATLKCPDGYSVAGSRGCFTVDTVSKSSGSIYGVQGRVISRRDCGNMIVALSGSNAEGKVICDGNGTVSDIAGGAVEPWEGNLIECSEEPSSVSLKIATCMEEKRQAVDCPDGYTLAGSRGCFTIDSVSRKRRGMVSVRGKVVSKKPCENLIVALSGMDADGNVLCSGNGMVADVAAGRGEPWDGTLIDCKKKPDTVTLKLASCM